jgi:hypothetical protein
VQTPFYDGVRRLLTFKASFTVNLTIPSGHQLFVSFPQEKFEGCVTLLADQREGDGKREYCCMYPSSPLMYNNTTTTTNNNNNNNAAYLTVEFWNAYNISCCIYQYQSMVFDISGFQMKFSFLTSSTTLKVLPSGLWNCSVPHWSDLKHHFPCNLQKNCEEGEDEVDCPYYRWVIFYFFFYFCILFDCAVK